MLCDHFSHDSNTDNTHVVQSILILRLTYNSNVFEFEMPSERREACNWPLITV